MQASVGVFLRRPRKETGQASQVSVEPGRACRIDWHNSRDRYADTRRVQEPEPWDDPGLDPTYSQSSGPAELSSRLAIRWGSRQQHRFGLPLPITRLETSARPSRITRVFVVQGIIRLVSLAALEAHSRLAPTACLNMRAAEGSGTFRALLLRLV